MSKQQNIGDFLDMVPPQDLEAERALLGSLLFDNAAVDVVDPIVSTKCFYSESHRKLYAAIYDMYQENRRSVVDALTLRDEMQRRGQWDEIGGVEYVMQIMETTPHAIHADHYAKIVREKYRQRQVIEACTQSLKDAYNGHSKAESIVASAERALSVIAEAETAEIGTGEMVVAEMMERLFSRLDNDAFVDGVPIEWETLRVILDSFAETCLYVLAARPGNGKTACAVDLALSVARKGDGVLFVSMEVPRVQLAQRFASRMSGVNLQKIRNASVNETEQHQVFSATEQYKTLPIRIADGRYKITHLKQIIRQEYRKHQTRLVVIDYLQLIEPSEHMLRSMKTDQVGEITRELKLLANELKIPIIALAQLNRGVENREDKTPLLRDLRDSGSIEQDADVVMFLVNMDDGDGSGLTKIKVAKNRHGPMGDAYLRYDKTCGRFYGPSMDEGNSPF